MKKIIQGTIVVFIFSQFSSADLVTGSFQNMDFETVIPVSGTYPENNVTTLANFPWKFNTQFIFIDEYLLGVTGQIVFRSNSFFSGSSSLDMETGWSRLGGSYKEINQSGFIPSSAKSIQLSYEGSTIPKILLGNTEILLTETSPGILAGDIQAWAGSTELLKVQVHEPFHEPDDYDASRHVKIDDIAFSTEAIPEPSTLGLIGLSLITLLIYRNKR